MFSVEVIEFLQRLLNPNGVQRWAERNKIKLPIGQIIQLYLNDIIKEHVPVGSEILVSYIKKDYNKFINTPAEKIVADINKQYAENPTCVDLFGFKFCWGNPSTNYWQIIGAGLLFGFIGYQFLKR
jgi:hypothetical protein